MDAPWITMLPDRKAQLSKAGYTFISLDMYYNMNLVTDPYGNLYYVIGNEEDFVCLDYWVDCENDLVVLHAVVNSETGGFIQRFAYEITTCKNALDVAQGVIDHAFDWCAENGVRVPCGNDDDVRFLEDLNNTISEDW